jgi:hypothetical protein
MSASLYIHYTGSVTFSFSGCTRKFFFYVAQPWSSALEYRLPTLRMSVIVLYTSEGALFGVLQLCVCEFCITFYLVTPRFPAVRNPQSMVLNHEQHPTTLWRGCRNVT